MNLTSNTFSTNIAAFDPAVYSLNLATTLSDCRFDKNSAILEGSSAAKFDGGVVRVLDTTFHQNTSPSSKLQQSLVSLKNNKLYAHYACPLNKQGCVHWEGALGADMF